MRLYRRLLKLYPAGFRENYAEAMERAFRDELQDASAIALWLRLLADLAVSLPAQLAREFAQDARHAFRLWRRGRGTRDSRCSRWPSGSARIPGFSAW